MRLRIWLEFDESTYFAICHSTYTRLKGCTFGKLKCELHTDEVLIALSICALNDKNAEKAINCLHLLKGCEVHSSVILSQVDVSVFRSLGINLTCEPIYQTNKLYHR